ncbi:cell wall integrity and stress response component 4-like [Plakobranchus ocellatus]|uniref:Cell wall integrity and stress response component 4-like n=1 Tax=Plakobranchus ocellatus TaxID=259542 RepID=A0AAV4B1V5_9GAST|nr:cell wall integrity and stress response component 4-like [Plakobranchus ocellatus]
MSHLPAEVSGHGYLAEPPGRSSMWKFDFDTEINYQHHELFCGGFQHQKDLGGKCGVCGDPWDGERHNEAGGKYATGIITRTYTQGAEVKAKVMITANHKGWFEFGICPVNNYTVKATEECLSSNLLQLADGSGTGTRYKLPSQLSTLFVVQLKLPRNLTCSQCVFRWKYNTGNSWGTDPDGRGCVGCGAQEQFYGSSDVAIVENPQQTQPPTASTPSTTAPPTSDDAPQATCPPSLVNFQDPPP